MSIFQWAQKTNPLCAELGTLECLILSFLNLETNQILYMYPEKCIKFKQAGKFEIWLSNFENPVFDFFVLYIYPKKEWIKQEIKSVHIGYLD